MRHYKDFLIGDHASIADALIQLNNLASDAILFVVDADGILKGSITDGDVRRGFIHGAQTSDRLDKILQPNPKFIRKGENDLRTILAFREKHIYILPVVDATHHIVNVVNLQQLKSYLPIDAVLMAGGRGERLRPLTDSLPKPLLPVGNTPIIELNMNRLAAFGIDDFWVSVRYMGEKIQAELGNGSSKNIRIQYIWEHEPLGTIGAVSTIREFNHDYVLVMNSDLLTNIDYEKFFVDFLDEDADMSIASIPYTISIPYAVLELENRNIRQFKEKPSYTYYANAGIYLLKKESLQFIPPQTFYNTTDLMERLIAEGKKVISYPLTEYWLDIGKHEDYKKAQEDIRHLQM